MKLRVQLALAVVLFVVAACSGSGQPGHTFELVEEDGIPIAVSSGVPRYDGELFSYEKILVIRPDRDNDESLLYRPFSFTLTDDGHYYVVDSGNHRIAVFDAAGNFVRAFGREGDGPGELRNPLLLEVRSDEVLVFDNRTTVFRTDGTFVDVLSYPGGRFARPTSNGSLFVEDNVRSNREGLVYSGARARVVDETGEVVASVETQQIHMDVMLVYTGAPSVFLTSDEEIVATTGAEPVISWYGLDGRLTRKARIDLLVEPITEADRAAVESLWDQQIERERRPGGDVASAEFLLSLKDDVQYPEAKAFWTRPIVDDAGWLWLPVPVADTRLTSIGSPPIETPPQFRIVDSRGEFIGITEWPADALTLRGTTIVRGHLLTMTWDDEAEERVPTVYRIRPAVEGMIYP